MGVGGGVGEGMGGEMGASTRSPISHHNFVKCGPIVTKRYMDCRVWYRHCREIYREQVNGQGQCYRNCEIHIIVRERHIVEMSNWSQNILKTKANKNRVWHFWYDSKCLASWRNLLRHSIPFMSRTTFWRHDVFLTSWWIFWRHDGPFGLLTCFWHHDEPFDVMTCFLTLT